MLGPAAIALALVAMPSAGAAGVVAKPKVVGQVLAIGGTKRLQARYKPGGPLHQLRVNENLLLGEEVVMGARVTATLRLRRPAGVSTETDLIDLTPVPRTPHKVVISYKAPYTTIKLIP